MYQLDLHREADDHWARLVAVAEAERWARAARVRAAGGRPGLLARVAAVLAVRAPAGDVARPCAPCPAA